MYRGWLRGRVVAVKRVLGEFYDVADREVRLLVQVRLLVIDSDGVIE